MVNYLGDWRVLNAGEWVTLYKKSVHYDKPGDPGRPTDFAAGEEGYDTGRWNVYMTPKDPDSALLRRGDERYVDPTYKGDYQIDEDSISLTE
ncbi:MULTISPECIES: hypothetical protein [Curtobacterium]|jgi:hypothetical protein|uniref:Uncharacterized protein n=4 Tax=Curtobacterium TaxID=2034 RepID=A0A9Q2W6C1_9MICO|nr:hypothetical protein [Curtobacterium flaccumfaciens]MBO9041441.1 hypothetical protein [Curtobacterium flaccumfaciens pv. flaccumfaciens]MBO9044927.1 hypothetical protein [Curtobacterium flaccumfaciens pv. flaccumfaciens]MBO9048930.1 hypothetical protein [Curtobacterium flaccumfaciens pv. flaccumfaciens]MBO9057781.1 hypothetical protein [Curtobacterium flaccumfaciens pv. flaccumfaciens]MBT1543220.1 hypothetical protein [Curtobacterium flaccumfaciens pv. flaccumfaciens]